MSNRLYVGNLSFNSNADTVRQAFASFGDIEDVHLVADRDTGRPRGFAFVTMASPDAANRAIGEMNGAMLDGRALRVNMAEERTNSRPSGGGGRGRQSGGGARW